MSITDHRILNKRMDKTESAKTKLRRIVHELRDVKYTAVEPNYVITNKHEGKANDDNTL